MAGATARATEDYAARFPQAAAGHFRPALGLTLSSLGLGTYLGAEDDAADRAYQAAVVAAVRGGINVIDTAINYRLQRSERTIGAALAELEQAGFPRQGVVVATKGGYVPAHDPEAYFEAEAVGRGLATWDDLVEGCHCIAPEYLRHQLARSLDNLGLRAVDVYYLHNPEQQFDEISRPLFLARVRAAFEMLEQEVAAGRVGAYGTATWNGYRIPPGEPDALLLPELVKAAREVGGEGHHFRVVQMPFNAAMPEALTAPTQPLDGRMVPLLAAAVDLGITVMTSAPLLQGRLPRVVPPNARAAMPRLATDAQRALQIARSARGVTTALVGMARAAHVQENLGLLAHPPLDPGAVTALVS